VNLNKNCVLINSNESYITLHYIKLHSGMDLPTTTIILPLNGVNSNLLNSSSQAFTRKFYYFIQKVKFLLVLVLNDIIQVPTE